MSEQHLDYHVGLLRGFILANNAHQSILHALDVLLTGYKSCAGPLIGHAQKPPTEHAIPKDMPIVPDVKKDEHKEQAKVVFWSGGDDDLLEEMYCVQGRRPKEIHEAMKHRTKGSISQRISIRGLKRGGK